MPGTPSPNFAFYEPKLKRVYVSNTGEGTVTVIKANGNDALAYDLAVTLNAWCFESDAAFNVTKGRALIAGYQSQRALQANEKAAFALLCRGADTPRRLNRTQASCTSSPSAGTCGAGAASKVSPTR